MGGPCFLLHEENGTRRRVIGPPATDNFQVRPFTFAGALWQSVEQCYQAFKFNDEGARERIRSIVPHAGESDHSHGMRVWSAGGSMNAAPLRSDWDAVKVEVMLRACRAKLAAHPDLAQQLLDTGDVDVRGAPSTDWHSQRTGSHNWSYWNGRIQLLLREELKAAATGSPLSERGAALATGFKEHMEAEGGPQHALPGPTQQQQQQQVVEEEAAAAAAAVTRETMYAYSADSATFVGSRHQPCRFRTSLCPHACGHATNVYTFCLDTLAVRKNEASKNAKWVTPVKLGDQHVVGEADFHDFKGVAQSLTAGQKVLLEWSHDYVTKNGCSGPDRPVTKLVALCQPVTLS